MRRLFLFLYTILYGYSLGGTFVLYNVESCIFGIDGNASPPLIFRDGRLLDFPPKKDPVLRAPTLKYPGSEPKVFCG